jgi:putative DNA primase/helicase
MSGESPEELLDRIGVTDLPPPAASGDVETPLFSEDDLALRFAERHAPDLRYVAVWSEWLCWDGRQWRIENTLRVFDLARIICREAAGECGKKLKKALTSAKTVAAIVTLARSDRRIAATSDQWDADPWLLNTPDGVVDLRTGRIRGHRAQEYMTRITAIGPHGDCPKFKAFLERIMGGDEGLIAYLKPVFGYCLTGVTTEQALFFAHGAGSNGKTVLMSTMAGILGDYCLATPIETFTESRTERHPTELARMGGARLVTATETEGGRYWAESRLKEITGGERIAARFMRQDFFEFTPQFKPFISGNHRPRLRSVGLAMRRRVNMIPFLVAIPEDERDPELTVKLKMEWRGILAWAIDGCLDWRKRGLAPPEAVAKATDAYFASEDGYKDWIADRCEIVAGFWSSSSQLFASWRHWAEKAGQPPGDNKRFREEMERLGFAHKHNMKGNFFVGLRIRQDPPEGHPTASYDGR